MNAVKPYLTAQPPWIFLPNCLDPTTSGTFPPTDWQDLDWRPEDLPKVLGYLSAAPVIICGFTPPIPCCLCDELFTTASVWRWDGCWLWCDILAHYVESHAVRPPEGMIRHIRDRAYTPPEESEIDVGEGQRVYHQMWGTLLPET